MRTDLLRLAFVFVLGLAVGCSRAGPAAAPEEAERAALARADAAATALGAALKGRLGAELPHGPVAAMAVCADEAQGIGARVAREQEAAVGRASLRTRNPQNAAPDWVRAWLKSPGARPAEGAVGISRVEDASGARMARVLKPIAVETSCVLCHGPREQLAPEVAAALEARYPSDGAIGYAVGDLRGALWAEVPVASP